MALTGYANRSRPKIGSYRKGRAMNHFELIEHLLKGYPIPTMKALEKVQPEKVSRACKIVGQFPFSGIFSRERKRLISRLLMLRADRLFMVAQGRR